MPAAELSGSYMAKKKFNYLKFIYDQCLYRDFKVYCAYHPDVSKRRAAYWFLVHRGFKDKIKDIIDRASFVNDPVVQKVAKTPWLDV